MLNVPREKKLRPKLHNWFCLTSLGILLKGNIFLWSESGNCSGLRVNGKQWVKYGCEENKRGRLAIQANVMRQDLFIYLF